MTIVDYLRYKIQTQHQKAFRLEQVMKNTENKNEYEIYYREYLELCTLFNADISYFKIIQTHHQELLIWV